MIHLDQSGYVCGLVVVACGWIAHEHPCVLAVHRVQVVVIEGYHDVHHASCGFVRRNRTVVLNHQYSVGAVGVVDETGIGCVPFDERYVIVVGCVGQSELVPVIEIHAVDLFVSQQDAGIAAVPVL